MRRSKSLIDEAKKYAPAVVEAREMALGLADRDTDYIRLRDEFFATSPQIWFDYAEMEKTDKACVLPVDYSWSDIGSSDEVSDHVKKDELENAIIGYGQIMISRNVTIHSENMLTAVIGCTDIAVVATEDSVLVVKRGQSELVKDMVQLLEQIGLLTRKGDANKI